MRKDGKKVIGLKSRKGALSCMFCGVFLLLLCILCQRSLAVQNRIANGGIGAGKAVLTLKRNSENTGGSGFSIRDLKEFSKKLNITDITYFARSAAGKATAEANGSTCNAAVTGTNYMLPRFMTLPLVSGCFFTKSMEEEGDAVAVVDEVLAWKVFGSVDIKGKTIKLNGSSFRITGVFKKDASLTSSLTDDGLSDIYIPGRNMLKSDDAAEIDSIQVKTPDNSTLDQNRTLIIDALEKAGKNAFGYSITDFNITQALLDQKPDMAVFAIGAATILMLVTFLFRILLAFAKQLRTECRSDYLTSVLKESARTILLTFLKISFVLFGVILTAFFVRFRFYAPPKLVPERLIDVAYYFELIKSGIQGGVANMGQVASYPELYAGKIGMITNWLFIVLAAGALMLFIGAGRMESVGMDLSRSILAAGLIFILSIAIQLIALKAAELPFALKLKDLFSGWLFINILIFSRVRSCDRN